MPDLNLIFDSVVKDQEFDPVAHFGLPKVVAPTLELDDLYAKVGWGSSEPHPNVRTAAEVARERAHLADLRRLAPAADQTAELPPIIASTPATRRTRPPA